MSNLKSRVSIRYGDIAPEAKENFIVSTDDKALFIDLTQLNMYNLDVKNYANPCEQYSVLLDGTSELFPEYPEDTDMGYWSESVSNASKQFDSPIVIELTSQSGNYTSKGFTFTFDTFNNIFCNSLNIKWYQGEELLQAKIKVDGETQIVDADLNFTPTSAFYFCEAEVEYFNKVVITFHSMNMAYQRLKIRSIDYGYGTYFYGDELRNVNVIQEIDPVSRSVMINVVDFSLDSKRDTEYNFQQKQPLSVYFNNKLIQTQFVDTSKKTGQRQWNIQSNDYIGYLDKITFMGGIYEGKSAAELLESISAQTNIPFEISAELSDLTIDGHIGICTCREAIQKIAFACCCVVDTSGSAKVKFYNLNNTIAQNIPLKRIRQGQSFETSDRITEVQLTQHKYVKNQDVTELYNASESGTGENLLVKFSSPAHSLTISNGTIINSGANFAVINANSGCILSGKGYDDNTVIKSKKNPNVLASDIENIVSITDETLVSSQNFDRILNNCYNYYIKNNRVSLKIEQGMSKVKFGDVKFGEAKFGEYLYDEPVNVGDVITAETLYLGTLTGRITSSRFNLNGGIIVKECEMI